MYIHPNLGELKVEGTNEEIRIMQEFEIFVKEDSSN